MKRKDFNIPLYMIDVTFVEFEKGDKEEDIESVVEELGITGEDGEAVVDNAVYFTDGGNTFRDWENKRVIIVIYPCSNEEERRMVVNHEKRHLEDRCLEFLKVKDIESAAYLAGFVSRYIY